MSNLDFTPTIRPENMVPGLVINFGGELASAINGLQVPVWAAEVRHVEPADGLGGLGLYVMPEDADPADREGNDLYLWPTPGVSYEIVG